MTEAEAKLLHKVERREYQNKLAYWHTRQGAFENAMLHFDHPLLAGGRDLEASDNGIGAEQIFAHCEEMPLWQKLWWQSYARLPPNGKKVINALKIDWRSRPAAKIAGVDHKTVDAWKKIFKTHFAQCYQAWKCSF